MLLALMDGRALTASELAYAARIAPPTASGHLGKLVGAKLLALEKQGDLMRALPLMQAHVAYLQQLAHPDAEKRAARLALTQAQLIPLL